MKTKTNFIVILLIQVLSILVSKVVCGGLNWASVSPFISSAPNYQFIYNQYYEVTRTVTFKLDSLGDSVVATGDFFNERRTDILILGCERTCLYLMEWDHPNWRFNRGETEYLAKTKYNIEHVIPGDYNYDGYLDIFVQFKSHPKLRETNVTLFVNPKKNKVFEERKNDEITFTPLPLDHLLPIDYNSNYNLDLFGISEKTEKIGVWINSGTSTDDVKFTFKALPELPEKKDFYPSRPFTPSFIDLNGDCSSDIFFSRCMNESEGRNCETSPPIYEIWVNKDGKFEYSHSFKGIKGAERVIFDDIDRDGNFDMVFYVCYPRDTCAEVSKLVIWYNQQEKMCKTNFADQNFCKKSKSLCDATKLSNWDWFGSSLMKEYPLEEGRRLVKNSHGTRQVTIGDFNLDGFPDIFLITESLSGDDRRIELFRSVECKQSSSSSSSRSCSSKEVKAGLRDFVSEPAGIGDLKSLNFPDTVFLIDLDSMGHVDVMVQSSNLDGVTSSSSSGGGGQYNYSTHVFYNNYYNDAFFLKTYNLNGSPSHGSVYPLRYGAYLPGSIIKFTIKDEKGKLQPHIGTLKASSTHGNIETPYILLGTGRTTDYIQTLHWAVPVTAKGEKYHDTYDSLVPNSQVVCIPRIWKIELFQIPSKHALWVGVTVVSTLVLLGIPICCCYCCEEINERREKRKKKELEGVFIST